MRKILLASVAMVVATGAAIAADPITTTTTISTEVAASCITPTSTAVTFATPTVGAESTGDFSFKCNFANSNGSAPNSLKVKFSSEFGGLKNSADPTHIKKYNLKFPDTATPDIDQDSDTLNPSAQVVTTSAGANTNTTKTYRVKLLELPNVAGTYSDNLTITISF